MDINNSVQTYNEIAEDYLREFKSPSDHIDSFVKALPKNAKVLDLGCGPGMDTAYLTQHNFDVHAVDNSPKMIALAKKQTPQAKFETANMLKIEYPEAMYDGIIASYSFIHIPKENISELFKNLIKALKPNGLLFIGLQMGVSEEVEINEPFNPKLKIFLNIFSKAEVHQLLNENNLNILEEYERLSESEEELEYKKYSVLAQKG